MTGRRLAACALFLAVAACGGGDDDDAPRGTGGAAGSAGGAGAGGTAGFPDELPATTDVLAPSSYDCSAKTPPTPPPRPMPAGCLSDPTCSARFVVQHRMGGPFAPENTASALRAAILLGVDVAETDLRLTADGHVVLVHDAEVDRTFAGTGDVEKLTLAEIQAMKVKPEPTDPASGDFACETVLTLPAAMAIAKGKIVVELETKRTEAGIAAAKYLKENDLYGSAYIQCDSTECMAIRAAVPDVPIMLRALDPADLDLLPVLKPILVEIDPSPSWLEPATVAKIRASGAKVFTNGFLDADIAAVGSDDLSGYFGLWDRGADCVQTEFSHWALLALGRLPKGK